MTKTPGLFASRTSTMRPVRLTLSRFPDERIGSIEERPGAEPKPYWRLKWVLALNEIALMVITVNHVGSPAPSWTDAPEEMQTLRAALEAALDTKALIQDLRPD